MKKEMLLTAIDLQKELMFCLQHTQEALEDISEYIDQIKCGDVSGSPGVTPEYFNSHSNNITINVNLLRKFKRLLRRNENESQR